MIRCAEKCGFALEKRRPRVREVRGLLYDSLQFGLDRERWEAGRRGVGTRMCK